MDYPITEHEDLDRLDRHVEQLRVGKHLSGRLKDAYWALNKCERLYIALALDRNDLLKAHNLTIVQAMRWIGPLWRAELIDRWTY